MTGPLRRLKLLPWRSLLQVAVLTTLIVIGINLLILLGLTQSVVINKALKLLYSPPLNIFLLLGVSVGIGALAVYLLERLHQQVIINTASLWALVLCLGVTFVIKSFLPLPEFFVSVDEVWLIGVVVGVFWKGRPYWR
jgi:branched-subunit amino acid ABC-type transport system permease component